MTTLCALGAGYFFKFCRVRVDMIFCSLVEAHDAYLEFHARPYCQGVKSGSVRDIDPSCHTLNIQGKVLDVGPAANCRFHQE